ncbi:polysaccharide biosynthesis/export family protein [sulfur-oxidizing endosymbiont of Gigantopelta aegis]|uniref:polysaccharide biosynthesis/export family protein n=1 Tax=sulfur-oxidizing endosymbiont of Gigantopelta aegis TaxID=2794934 RepID=UPI0018DD7816|nr:polysaccharide biosynthesis/export family protein [sulfur-oxidizing endosymbiont of Gigantopelta aegis]
MKTLNSFSALHRSSFFAPRLFSRGAEKLVVLLFALSVILLTSPALFASETSYRLSSGDRIKIIVYGEEDLTLETTLGDSGIINYPFLGEINVEGMTVKILEKKIFKHLKGDYLLDPNVNVSIESYRPFFVNGQVKKPGGYPYQPGLTLRRAISLAGGYTERASKSNTFVIHQNQPEQRIKAKQYTKIKPGDTITVEESFF